MVLAFLCTLWQVMTVQLHNTKLVPCEWSVKKPDGNKCKDWHHFRYANSFIVLTFHLSGPPHTVLVRVLEWHVVLTVCMLHCSDMITIASTAHCPQV
jgi:hypothetical protein